MDIDNFSSVQYVITFHFILLKVVVKYYLPACTSSVHSYKKYITYQRVPRLSIAIENILSASTSSVHS